MNLFKTVIIDDERTFESVENPAIYIRSSETALTFLEKNKDEHIDTLYLDHDLGDGDDIRVVVNWLAEAENDGHPLDVDIIYAHTMNPVGGDYIVKALQHHQYNVVRIPLPDLIDFEASNYKHPPETPHGLRLILGGKS